MYVCVHINIYIYTYGGNSWENLWENDGNRRRDFQLSSALASLASALKLGKQRDVEACRCRPRRAVAVEDLSSNKWDIMVTWAYDQFKIALLYIYI